MLTSHRCLAILSPYKNRVFSLHFSNLASNFFTEGLGPPLRQGLLSLADECRSVKEIRALHAQFIVCGFSEHNVALSRIISFCALSELGDIRYAQILFDKFPNPNRHMYNSLIRGYSNSDPDKAVFLYKKMILSGILPNEFTFPFVLKASAIKGSHIDGVLVHVMAMKLGYEAQVFVQNGLINVYVGCGEICCARKVFDGIHEKTLISWNSMISGYSKVGCCPQAFLLFQEMWEEGYEPDSFTFVSLLSVSSRDCQLELGRFVHSYIVRNGINVDIHVQNALLDIYAKNGNLHAAESVFDQMVDRNVVSWTSLLSAYSNHGFVGLAEDIFKQMPVKNVVSWNSMISCFVHQCCWQEALDIFFKMCNSMVEPDEITLVSILSVCSQRGDFALGNKIHDYIRVNYMKPTVTLYNALIDMYSKCGSVGKAFDLFLEMPYKNVVSWNTIIGAFAFHGNGNKAIELFEEMQTGEIWPDKITFIGLLSACCHAGLVNTGKYYFEKMAKYYGLSHEIEHFACMVDILARGGQLDEAVKLIKSMPMKPDAVVLGALLGACRIHRNIFLANQVLKQLLELRTETGGLYVLMSNVYCEAQSWIGMRNMRKLMQGHDIRKHDALSSIEIEGCIHKFMVDDKKHEASNAIYLMLDQLTDQTRAEKYFFCY